MECNRDTLSKSLKLWTASLMLFGLLAAPAASAVAESAETPQQYSEVKRLLERVHIGGNPVGEAAEGAKTIDELLKGLDDPYTDFFDEAEWQEFQNSIALNYAGIGMRVGQDENGFLAVEVFRGSPAEAAGILRGDYIEAVDGHPTSEMRLEEMTALIRGEEQTEVKLRIKRDGVERDVVPVRGQIYLPTVSGGAMSGNVGYVNVDSFAEDTDEKFGVILRVLKKAGVNGLVIDVRDNPGGLLETAKLIASQFIEEGILIHTRDKNNSDDPVWIENGQTVPFPVVLLVNENSASASEVLTAALQDYGVAVAVGTRTYGKGSVQALYEMRSGGVLKVTVEEYLSPLKREVNKVGVEPDVRVEGYVPQLLTALHWANAERIELEIERHLYRVNGFEFYDAEPQVLTLDGGVYVPARILAALAGQPIAWVDAIGGVAVGEGEETVRFDPESGFRLNQEIGYIEIESFRQQFPQVGWTKTQNKMVLVVEGTRAAWEK